MIISKTIKTPEPKMIGRELSIEEIKNIAGGQNNFNSSIGIGGSSGGRYNGAAGGPSGERHSRTRRSRRTRRGSSKVY